LVLHFLHFPDPNPLLTLLPAITPPLLSVEGMNVLHFGSQQYNLSTVSNSVSFCL
jgi:hypothetical protein